MARLGAIAISVSFGLLGFGCTYTPNATSQAEVASIPSATLRGFTISDVRFIPYTENTGGSDVAGKLYLVTATIQNNTNETKVPGGEISYKVIDSEGREYKAAAFGISVTTALSSTIGGKEYLMPSNGILPGTARQDILLGIYDVNPEAQGFQLCLGWLTIGKDFCAPGAMS